MVKEKRSGEINGETRSSSRARNALPSGIKIRKIERPANYDKQASRLCDTSCKYDAFTTADMNGVAPVSKYACSRIYLGSARRKLHASYYTAEHIKAHRRPLSPNIYLLVGDVKRIHGNRDNKFRLHGIRML